MIESRRWPNPTLPRSTSPLSSGPRWAISSVMRSSSRASATAPRPNSNMPAMPHIAGSWAGSWRDVGSRAHGCGHGAQQLLDAMPVCMLRHDKIIGALGDAGAMAGITKPFDRVVDIREIFSNGDVMLVRFQNTVVVPFEQELARLGPDRLEVARRDAFPGNAARQPAVKPAINLVERGGPVLVQIISARPIEHPSALVEVIGAGFGADQRLAAIEKQVPFLARQAALSDVAAQATRRSVPLEPFDDVGAFTIAEERPIDIPGEADIDVARLFGREMKICRVERMRHLDNLRAGRFAIEIASGLDRQLRANKLRARLADKADLIGKQVVFVADKDDERRTPAVEQCCGAQQQTHIVTRRGVRHDDQTIFFQTPKTGREVQQIVDVAPFDIQLGRAHDRLSPIDGIGKRVVDVAQLPEQRCGGAKPA